MSARLCIGCNRELHAGDLVIEDTTSGFLKSESEPEIDGLLASIFGGASDKVYFCEDCCEPGGDHVLHPLPARDAA